MTYVTLWSPARTGGGPGGPPGAAPAPNGAAPNNPPAPTGLLARLLELAPHVAAEPRAGGTLVWVDGRGLPTRPLARAVLRAAEAAGVDGPRIGVAAVPVAAEVAARRGIATPNGASGRSPNVRPCRVVAPGAERAFLAGHPIAVLLGDGAGAPALRAVTAFAAAGVTTCGELAALTQAAVEVRTGAAGAALWRLARGEDRRVVFRHATRERPSASLDWAEFELRDPAPLMFAAGALVARVCAALAARGDAARVLTVTLALAGGARVVRRVRSGRDTADPAVWRRLVRAEFERVGAEAGASPTSPDAGPAPGPLADGVVGLALAVEAARAAESPQGDLFDRGAASAGAAERAAARLAEAEWGTIVRPRVSGHPVPERRLAWEPVEPDAAVRAMQGASADLVAKAVLKSSAGHEGPAAPGVRLALVRPSDDPGAAPAAVRGLTGVLGLRGSPEPRALVVTERSVRGHRVPVRYRERAPDGGDDGAEDARAARGGRTRGRPLVEVVTATGPDRVVTGHADGSPVARDYWYCHTSQGELVLLYSVVSGAGAPAAGRDAGPAEGRWFLHGWWF